MIKEKNKKKPDKTLGQLCLEYLRTVLISCLIAVIITVSLTIRARNDMIKNIYKTERNQKSLDQELARQLVAKSDMTQELFYKKYTVCLQVGNLYEAAGDYEKAQYAFELAVDKAKPGVYTPYSKLVSVLIAQDKFDEANKLLDSVLDISDKKLIKFKTRAYIEMGDKYYSMAKFLKASSCYEKAEFYYDKFSKKDRYIDNAIKERLIKSYVNAADVIVSNGYNSDAIRYLKKARKYAPDDYKIQYKLAIVYADLDPIKSVDYFEPLLNKIPQHIDYTVYNTALMKAANIADLSGQPTKAKYYRYKVHSVDLFINNKVVYKDDIDVYCTSYSIRKFMFTYHLKYKYRIKNISSNDITKLSVQFVLRQGDKPKESYTVHCVNRREEPLLSNGSETSDIEVNLGKKIYTKKELEQYALDIYVFKDEKYKTLYGSFKIPTKSF